MKPQQQWDAVMTGKPLRAMPFFPDITNWYYARRYEHGKPAFRGCGAFLSDNDPYHRNAGTMPGEYRDLTLLGFYRHFGWGMPIHHYDWVRREYIGNVARTEEVEGNRKTIRLHTPKGTLTRREGQAADGSWCCITHFCKEVRDLDIMRLVTDALRYVPQFGRVSAAMGEFEGTGVGDVVLDRSPFGKLVHEFMGFERTIYALYDDRRSIDEFLEFQEQKDFELVRLAAQSPAPLVILSDHADENLISPRQLDELCIPYYRKVTAFLHEHGKYVSTHLDGNFKGFFPLLSKTGFDLLDGCTPAPMFNYEVQELAAALPPGMKTYCGVPATLFCQHVPTAEILAFGDRIARALAGRGILNVGDILPADGDIEQVIALGKHIQGQAN